MSMEELALMIGVPRQTTNQILNALKVRHIERIQRDELDIVDLSALHALCQ